MLVRTQSTLPLCFFSFFFLFPSFLSFTVFLCFFFFIPSSLFQFYSEANTSLCILSTFFSPFFFLLLL